MVGIQTAHLHREEPGFFSPTYFSFGYCVCDMRLFSSIKTDVTGKDKI